MRVHDSQARRKMDVTREHISRILELVSQSFKPSCTGTPKHLLHFFLSFKTQNQECKCITDLLGKFNRCTVHASEQCDDF